MHSGLRDGCASLPQGFYQSDIKVEQSLGADGSLLASALYHDMQDAAATMPEVEVATPLGPSRMPQAWRSITCAPRLQVKDNGDLVMRGELSLTQVPGDRQLPPPIESLPLHFDVEATILFSFEYHQREAVLAAPGGWLRQIAAAFTPQRSQVTQLNILNGGPLTVGPPGFRSRRQQMLDTSPPAMTIPRSTQIECPSDFRFSRVIGPAWDSR